MFTRSIITGLLLICANTVLAQKSDDPNCNNFLAFNKQLDKTRTAFQSNPEQLAWQWFACLNMQKTGTKNRIWEGFKPDEQIYLPNGAAPLPYAQRSAPPQVVLDQAKSLNMDMSRTLHEIDSIQQVDGLILEIGGSVPKAQLGKPVRFQLLMERDAFNYIVAKNVYNINGQAALTANLNFPATAWELKTAWIWIGTDTAFQAQMQADGYYIGQAYYLDKTTKAYKVGYAALSGMHVINKLFPSWVWTTFENVNNKKYTVTNSIPSQPMTNTTGPTSAAASQNGVFQKQYPSLSQYELIGVQWQAGAEPVLLANSQLESAFQSNSSCLACHSTAAFSLQNGYFNFALSSGGGIAYPLQPLPDADFAGYKKLDFVWSLKRAQWKR